MKILHVDTSPASRQQSMSRSITGILVKKLKQKYTATTEYLDASTASLPTPSDDWFVNTHSDTGKPLAKKVIGSDIIVLGAPVNNLFMTTTLKAFMNQIVLAGTTFDFTADGPQGLIPPGKKVYIIATSSARYDTLSQYGINFHEHYLRGILKFIGLDDITILSYNGRTPDEISEAIEKAGADIEQMDL
jgi:FMN-dependent NADH-azoreductase